MLESALDSQHMLAHGVPLTRSRLSQAAVGTLLAKTLTTSTTNPYVSNPSTSYTTPAALDVFSVQVG